MHTAINTYIHPWRVAAYNIQASRLVLKIERPQTYKRGGIPLRAIARPQQPYGSWNSKIQLARLAIRRPQLAHPTVFTEYRP